jgi:hypothetical protein
LQNKSQSSFPKKSQAAEKQQREKAVEHRVALGDAGTLALKSLRKSDACLVTLSAFEVVSSWIFLIRDVEELRQQLNDASSDPVVYKSHSLAVAHWLSRVRTGGNGGSMQLGLDAMQRLLLSPVDKPLPSITKDPASMLHLGLTDEASQHVGSLSSSSSHAADHTCFTRAFSFNASPVNGSVRSAITQATFLPYFYLLCAQMKAKSHLFYLRLD